MGCASRLRLRDLMTSNPSSPRTSPLWWPPGGPWSSTWEIPCTPAICIWPVGSSRDAPLSTLCDCGNTWRGYSRWTTPWLIRLAHHRCTIALPTRRFTGLLPFSPPVCQADWGRSGAKDHVRILWALPNRPAEVLPHMSGTGNELLAGLILWASRQVGGASAGVLVTALPKGLPEIRDWPLEVLRGAFEASMLLVTPVEALGELLGDITPSWALPPCWHCLPPGAAKPLSPLRLGRGCLPLPEEVWPRRKPPAWQAPTPWWWWMWSRRGRRLHAAFRERGPRGPIGLRPLATFGTLRRDCGRCGPSGGE